MNWTFGTSDQSWTGGTFNGTAGNPAGCLHSTGGGAPTFNSPTGLGAVVATNDSISCQVRVTANGTGAGGTMVIRYRIYANTDYDFTTSFVVPTDPVNYDSGWIWISDNLPGGGTVDSVGVQFNYDLSLTSYPYEAFVDNVYLDESPAATETAQKRLLGLAADSGNLYATGITNGTISFYTYSQSTLDITGTSTFGTCSYTDPDSFTRGLLPAAQPGADGVVYVYGRDANNKQIQYNDTSGTAGFVDVGAGTATWGTTKYCVALLPDVLRPLDVIAAFSDNDVYRTETGTSAWTKQGDASTGLRTAAARHPAESGQIWLAGTAAGTLLYSPNLGVGYSNVGGGTVLSGTINAIEAL